MSDSVARLHYIEGKDIYQVFNMRCFEENATNEEEISV